MLTIVVELKQIDGVASQPLQARLQRRGYRRTDLAALGRRQANLCADIDIRLQRFQHAAEIALGFAVAIHLRRVEVVDAELDRARHRALLVGGGALDHQPADGAAAKAEQRDVETGPAEFPSFHRFLPHASSDAPDQIARGPAMSILPVGRFGEKKAIAFFTLALFSQPRGRTRQRLRPVSGGSDDRHAVQFDASVATGRPA